MAEPLGATYLGDGRCRFVVWAPRAGTVEVHLLGPEDRVVCLAKGARGYHSAVVEGVLPGSLYLYRLDRRAERPDPASRFQPLGVHKPSAVVDSRAFSWSDSAWSGLSLEDYVLYELHVGTFTPEGTFDAVIPHLEGLAALGVTAIELMPVAQFPGTRNWGYDGVHPFAVQNSYGGPECLKRLVNACHQRGLAVVLDVVYNHLGPEGNYLGDFGPYFTDRYRSPWGEALNFDGPFSNEVVRFFTENALCWLDEFHIDALRLDAIHGIVDRSAEPFLKLLNGSVREFAARSGRRVHSIAESDFNDVRFLLPSEALGYGFDAQWNDDFHHALHTLLTGEQSGYYRDFGNAGQLAEALNNGFVYTGQYSEYRRQRHGNSSRGFPPHRFVVFAQNHDQVGNRAQGDRLSTLVSFEALKVAAGVLLLSPFIPLIFMGEEYGETAPFQYFTSHGDPELVEAVRRGRRQEFASFGWGNDLPDPQADSTFERSMIDTRLAGREPHSTLREFYRELLRLRRTVAGLAGGGQGRAAAVSQNERVISLARQSEAGEAWMAFSLSERPAPAVTLPRGSWRLELDSAAERWKGKGSSVPARVESAGDACIRLEPWSCALFSRIAPV